MASNPFTYTAREDDNTGMLYYRARYYDPNLELFISQDPLGGAQRYVGGNPVKSIDPFGLFILPSDPSGLPPGWKFDSSHRDPCGERYRNPNSDILDYHKPRPDGNSGGGGKCWKEKPHWHYNEGKKHYSHGEYCPESFGDEILPFTPFPFPAPFGMPSLPTIPAIPSFPTIPTLVPVP